MRILAIVPARAGSKRLPRKNLLEVGGKTLVQRAVEQASRALASGLVDEAVLTTDLADLDGLWAMSLGVQVRVRPTALCTDTATMIEVIEDVLRETSPAADAIVVLQPTSPLRTDATVRRAVEALKAGAECAVSVTADPGAYFVGRVRNGQYEPRYPEERRRPRMQDINLWRECGSVFALTVAAMHEHGTLVLRNAVAVPVHRSTAVDVDTMDDLIVARALHEETERDDRSM